MKSEGRTKLNYTCPNDLILDPAFEQDHVHKSQFVAV